jgi:hypothetical protein
MRFELPMQSEFSRLREHCRLDIHIGIGWIKGLGCEGCLDVQIIYPAYCDCIILMAGHNNDIPPHGLGTNLQVRGESPDGPFELQCPQFFLRSKSTFGEKIGWAVASPTNEAMRIVYLPEERPKKLRALINNFDFLRGDPALNGESGLLTVEADGRPVVFQRRDGYVELKRMIESGIISNTAFLSFSFDNWEGATVDDMNAFAQNIASFCALIDQQHTGIPVISFLDDQDRVIIRLIYDPIDSACRANTVFGTQVPGGITAMFRNCFVEHVQMQKAPLPWRKLKSYCASIEDLPYLEQKFASLMMALEFFMKNSLLEGSHPPPPAEAEKMDINKLISKCRHSLGWDFPKHYTSKDLHRLLRNAVMHGGELPFYDIAEFSRTFEKWRLFLIRRVLIRLGYDGPVRSPNNGCPASSPVDDFSESHNSFKPAPGL